MIYPTKKTTRLVRLCATNFSSGSLVIKNGNGQSPIHFDDFSVAHVLRAIPSCPCLIPEVSPIFVGSPNASHEISI